MELIQKIQALYTSVAMKMVGWEMTLSMSSRLDELMYDGADVTLHFTSLRCKTCKWYWSKSNSADPLIPVQGDSEITKHCYPNLIQMPSESDSVLLLVGDDGTNKEATSTGKLNQENEHIYNLWCSGRVCCEGMLIQLRVSRERLLRQHPPLRFKSEQSLI